MKKHLPELSEAALLRQRAEAKLKTYPPGIFTSQSESDYIKLIYELHVHQVELEMQNDELQAAVSRAKDATDLYDFAPTGYFILSVEGEILRLNLSGAEILGKGRTQLLNSRFSFFVSNSTRPDFNFFLERVFKNKARETCEIILSTNDNLPIYAYLTGIITDNADQCLITVTDITEHKLAEDKIVRQNELLSKITRFSIDLAMLPATENLEVFIVKRIKELTGAAAVTYSEYDIESHMIVTRHIEVDPGILKKAIGLLGNQIQNVHSPVDEETYRKITENIIGRYETITELSFGAIPPPVGSVLSALLKSDRYFGIAYLIEGKLYGTSILAMSKHLPDPPDEVLRNIAFLVAVSLRRKKAEEALTQSEVRYRTLYENSLTGILITHPDGSILTANPEACRLLDRTESEICHVGRRGIMDLSNPLLSSALAERTQYGQFRGELTFVRSDGTIFPADIVSAIFSDSSGQLHSNIFFQDISKRKLAEEALLNEQWRMASIIEGTNAGTWEWNVQTGETFFNQQWAQIIGYSLEELKPCNISVWEKYAHPDDLKRSTELLQKHFSGELPYYESDCRMKHKDGHWVWVLDRGRVITRTADGKPLMMFGTHTDISERKETEKALVESEANLTAIFNATDESVMLFSFDETILALNNTTVKKIGISTGKVSNQKVNELMSPEISAQRRSFMKQVWEKGEPVVFEDTYNGKWFINRIFPILDETGKVDRIAFFVRDITEEKQAEIALREAENQYRLMAENVTDVIWVQDLESNEFKFVSPSVERMFGFSVEYVMKNKITNLLSTDSLNHLQKVIPERIERFKNGIHEIYTDEFKHLHKNGNTIWVSITTQILLNSSNGRLEVTGVVHDITEHKVMEENLRLSANQLNEAQEIGNIGSFCYTVDSKTLSCTPMIDKILDLNSDQATDPLILKKLLHPDDRKIMLSHVKDCLDNGVPFDKDYRIIRQGKVVWLRCISRAEMDSSGKVLLFKGVIMDITESKQRQEALISNTLFTESLLNAIPTPIFYKDTDGRYIGVNKSFEKFYGTTSSEFCGKTVFEIAPKDLAEIYYAQDNELIKNQGVQVYDSIVKDSLGNLHDVIFHKATFLVSEGKVCGLIGMIIDVTERKLFEKALRESEARFKNMFEYHSAIMLLIDPASGLIIDANESATRFYGFSKSVLQSMKIEEINTLSLAQVKVECEKARINKLNYFVFQHRLSNGEDRIVEVHSSPIDLQDKQILFSVIHDITERRQAEEALSSSRQILEGIINTIPVRVFWKDKDLKYMGCNSMFLKDAGFTDVNEIIGKDDFMMSWRNQAELYRSYDKEVISSGIAKLNIEEPQTTPDGGTMALLTSKIPLRNHEGEINGILGTYMDITERKLAEEKLRLSEQRYRQLVDTANEVILVAQGNTFRFVNPMATELTGYTEEELISTPFIDFIHPDDRALVGGNYMKRLKGDIFDQRYSFRFIAKGNNLKWVEMTGVRIMWEGQPATLNFASDITARKQAEDALIESERHATALINAIPDILFIMNREGIFIDFRADSKDLAYQTDSIIGKRNRDIMPSAFADLIDEKIKHTFQKKDIQEFEYQLEIPGRGIIDYEARMVPYGTDEIVAIVRDVTGRKSAEIEINRKTEELIKANAEKDKFFSIIAHDLRGPIGGFMGLTERMAEGMADMTLDDLQNITRVMKKSASNLFNLLGNLLEWSRMQRGLTTFEPITFQLLPKIQEIMLLAHDAAAKKAIAINTSIPDDLKVFADQNMLSCIIRNLVTNAVKFTPNGGEISVLACPVKGKLIQISVSDNGIGMSKDLIENLFNHDVNTNRNGTNGELSSGLGLMICKDFIEKHGGVFKVESEVAKGSIFSFRIPAFGLE